MKQEEARRFLIQELWKEQAATQKIRIPKDQKEQKKLLRGLLNIRAPREIPKEIRIVQDAYLQEEIKRKGIVRIDDQKPVKDGLYIWQGDITTLHCDAIVNAANSGMTGCYVPNHTCIDNCIHTYAGMQLRMACAERMRKQGHEEPTGSAMITLAYNLPCTYILHTVGPIVHGEVTAQDRRLLANCYTSCLELAAKYHLESIAFCCISTGEYHFPNQQAAEIAVQTVTSFMKRETSVKKVIFNVFKDVDKELYEHLL